MAVVAWPDARLGETVCAYVVPTGEPFALEDLRAWLEAQKVTRYLYPQHLIFVDELPMTPTGKVRKAALQEDARRRERTARERGGS